jgi:hypothetical protein
MCLKILTDVLIILLNEENIYSTTAHQKAPDSTTGKLDTLITSSLIPLSS